MYQYFAEQFTNRLLNAISILRSDSFMKTYRFIYIWYCDSIISMIIEWKNHADQKLFRHFESSSRLIHEKYKMRQY